MIPFAARHPALFHVTRRAALDAIGRRGLLSAAVLGAAPDGGNRGDWTPVEHAGETAWLRWQGMSEAGLRSRLPAEITPAGWRRFVNGFVFFFEAEAKALRLLAVPRDRGVEQCVLRFETAALLAAGCDLRTCRWNNGYLDRNPPARRRLRRFDDWRPASEWCPGEKLAEIVVRDGVPARVPFTVLQHA